MRGQRAGSVELLVAPVRPDRKWDLSGRLCRSANPRGRSRIGAPGEVIEVTLDEPGTATPVRDEDLVWMDQVLMRVTGDGVLLAYRDRFSHGIDGGPSTGAASGERNPSVRLWVRST